MILLRLTTDGHKASRGLSGTAELFVLLGKKFENLDKFYLVKEFYLFRNI